MIATSSIAISPVNEDPAIPSKIIYKSLWNKINKQINKAMTYDKEVINTKKTEIHIPLKLDLHIVANFNEKLVARWSQ